MTVPTTRAPPSHPDPPPKGASRPVEPVSLSAFAEDWAEEALLSDMDFELEGVDVREEVSEARCLEGHRDQMQTQSLAEWEGKQTDVRMVMDPASKKWTGNEASFGAFYETVAGFGAVTREEVVRDAVFEVGDYVERTWQQVAREHNERFGMREGKDKLGKDKLGKDEDSLDIRLLAMEFEHRR